MTTLNTTQRPADDSEQWLHFYQQHIGPFWQGVQTRHFMTKDGLKLHWCYYKVTEQAPLVVISPGRIEAAVKYQEVIWELAQAGISCAIIDHRGQGLSQRMSPNPHQGHVDSFSDFVSDFSEFNEQLNNVFAADVKRWLLGHSMGAAIASLFLAGHQRDERCQHSNRYAELILTSPMFSINTAGIPVSIAKFIAAAGAWLNRQLAPQQPWYFWGMKDYTPIAFEKNELTHSRHRYQVFRAIYEQQPQLQLGGPTFNWLHQALLACEQTTQECMQIDCPITLFQAGSDQVVSARGQQRFLAQNSNAKKVAIAGARHELLMESDSYRQPVMEKLLSITAS